MKAMATVMSNMMAGSILEDALVITMHPFPVQVDLKLVMLALMTLKEVVLEMTMLDLAELTLMHLRVMVAEILVIFWIEVVVVCL